MKKLLFYFLLLLPLSLASCGSDDDEPQNNTTKDPDGTVLVNVKLGDYTEAAGCFIRLNADYNFNAHVLEPGGVVIVGPVKGIGYISITKNQVDELTWTSYAAAKVGYGYIFKGIDDSTYYAVYVVSEMIDTSGGVLGYTLKVRKLF